MDREQVDQKREEIRERLRQARKGAAFSVSDDVEATSDINTKINFFRIPTGTKGIVAAVYNWVEGYDVEFKVYGYKIVVACLADQVKKAK